MSVTFWLPTVDMTSHSKHASTSQDHHHDHSHHHHHIDTNMPSHRIAIAFFLNITFTIIEFVGGILTNSTAIMADAVHDLGDSLAIGFAWWMSKLSKKHANDHFTYGYQRFSLLSAIINGVVLMFGSMWILTEAIPRLFAPEMPHTEGMLGLAILGVLVNGYAAFKLSDGKTLNERMLNWHLLEDVLGWVAVLIVSIVLMFVEWPILDALLSVVFTLFILVNVVKNFNASIKLFLQAVPDKKLHNTILNQLKDLTFVDNIHHFHLWSLDGEQHVLTAHFVLSQAIDFEQQREMKQQIAEKLSPFNLAHTTIEFELADEVCRDHRHEHKAH